MGYKYHGTSNLIALPNRTVQTYPSGLVRVEQSFVCRKENADNQRTTLGVGQAMPLDPGPPALDGLFIFPEPQEIVREDGFVEFRVAAYGRSNFLGSSVLGVQLVNFTASYYYFFEIAYYWTIKEIWLVDTYALTTTILASQSNSSITINTPKLGRALKSREISGTQPPETVPGFLEIPGISEIKTNWETSIDGIDRRNFGTFDEISITFKNNTV